MCSRSRCEKLIDIVRESESEYAFLYLVKNAYR